MRKTPKGKLRQTQWLPTTTEARCYTCVFHNIESMTLAAIVRIQTYENVKHNTYYCAEHATAAKAAEANN